MPKHFWQIPGLLNLLLLSSLLAVAQEISNTNSSPYRPPVFTDDARTEKINSLLPAIAKMYKDYAVHKNLPGMVFGVVTERGLIFSGSAGYSNQEQKIPAGTQSLFRIASMTKSVTAMAILQLRDRGKIRLDDAVSVYLPVLKTAPLLTGDAPPVTIRDLLTHAAGFPEDNPWGDRQLDITADNFVVMLQKGISFSNVPGVAYEYSNMGFAMLGEIITVASGIPYQEYITRNILIPLGMTHTLWEYTKAPPGLLAHGYRWLNGNWQEEVLLHDGIYGAMGGLITSIEDFSKYIALHLQAWPPRNDADTGPVKRSSVREMHQLARSGAVFSRTLSDGKIIWSAGGYGYGLGIAKEPDGKWSVGHSGGLPGFGSNWRCLPDYGIAVVTFANSTYAGMGAINQRVLDTIVYAGGLQPKQLPVSAFLQKRKDELMRLLPNWQGAATSGIFAVNFFMDEDLSVRKKQTEALFKKAGKIIRVGELVPENQLRGSFIIEGEHCNIRVYFTLTPENPALIQQLDFREIEKK